MYLKNKEIPHIIVEVTHEIKQEMQIADGEKQKYFYEELLAHGYRWYSICASFGTMIYFNEENWEYIPKSELGKIIREYL